MAGPSYDTGAVLNQVQYADAQPLIPWEIRDEIFRMLPEASIAMKRFRKAPNMVGRETSQPVLSMLPEAFFVTGDEGYRQTSKMAWDRVQFFAEVLSVIVPIPITVVRDSRYPMWPQIQPELVAAIGRAFDKAVLWGTNSPATWPTNLYAQAASKGKVILRGRMATCTPTCWSRADCTTR
jgi:HK97 family phage major capsid protein